MTPIEQINQLVDKLSNSMSLEAYVDFLRGLLDELSIKAEAAENDLARQQNS